MTTPYRDDVAALQDRLTTLEQQLDEVQKKTRQLTALQGTETEIQGEIAILRRRLEGISARRLPLLESIRVASPCTADWDQMTGDDRVRFCGHCEKDVFNLSGMAREEAETLVRERGGDACIRLYRRTDGTVLTTDCPVGARRKRRRKVAAAAVGGGLLAAGAAFLHLRGAERPAVVMGAMSEVVPTSTAAVEPPPTPSVTPTSADEPPPAPTTHATPGGRPGHVLMGKPMMRR